MGAQDERPRFYEGQYLGAEDLAAILAYLRTADARHALGAHTWGIAAGLTLTEKPSPGAPDRVQVTLQPGLAWDGFGRPLLVTQPTRLPESLFQEIEADPIVDSPPPPAVPTGRLVKVWLGYQELGARLPAPGFESCLTDDQSARVRESFGFHIGEFAPGLQQRSPVSIGAVSVDAQQALTRFDAAADPLWDTSVPHQSFPLEARPPRRWLVPIGYVRWVAREGEPGYFVKRDKVEADKVEDRIRTFRRYLGTVAEYIESAAGVIVLHRRSEQRDLAHRFLGLLKAGHSSAELLQDLVWVEGNLRVEGDAKLAGGRLLFRDRDGLEQNTPLYLERSGDASGAEGARQLRVALGPASQDDNRFVVGRLAPGAPPPGQPPALDPTFVVVSNGDIGVGTSTPDGRVTVEGKVQPQQGKLTLFSASADFEYDGGSDKLFIFKDSGEGKTAFMGTRLGVGTASPDARLEVAGVAHLKGTAAFIPDPAKGARVSHVHWDANGDWYIRSAAGAGKVILQDGGGNVGIGTATPQRTLHVQGDRIRLENAGKRLDLRADGSAVDLHSETHKLYIQSSAPGGQNHVVINPHGSNGNVGIGTANPLNTLHVAKAGHLNAIFDRTDLSEHLTVVVGSAGSGLRYSQTNDFFIASQPYANRNDGTFGNERLRITAAGDVGIGATTPLAKLHVQGNFRVTGNARKPGGGLWSSLSDERLKTNIQSLKGALEMLLRLRGVRFEWREPEKLGEPPGPQMGLLAQEAEKVFPEWVGTGPDGYKELTITGIEALVIEALRELNGKCERLEAQVAELRARLPEAPKKDGRA